MSYVPSENPEAVAKAETYALAGFIFSILGFVSCGLGGLPGVALSIMGLKAQARKTLAIAGIICGCVSLVICIPGGLILTAIVVPSFVRAREISRRNACMENLSKLDGAKQQWMLENNVPDMSVTPPMSVLVGPNSYLRNTPICPSGGTYTVAPLVDHPYCSLSTPAGEFAHTFPQ